MQRSAALCWRYFMKLLNKEPLLLSQNAVIGFLKRKPFKPDNPIKSALMATQLLASGVKITIVASVTLSRGHPVALSVETEAESHWLPALRPTLIFHRLH